MTRLATVAAIALVGAMSSADAFTAPAGKVVTTPTFVTRTPAPRMAEGEGESDSGSEESASPSLISFVERGVSVDQDGKSNVWAIEPKMEVDTKSREEKTSSTLFAVGGVAAFAAVAAVVLTNLPDPNQF